VDPLPNAQRSMGCVELVAGRAPGRPAGPGAPVVLAATAASRLPIGPRSFRAIRRIIRRSDFAMACPVGSTTATVSPDSFCSTTVCAPMTKRMVCSPVLSRRPSEASKMGRQFSAPRKTRPLPGLSTMTATMPGAAARCSMLLERLMFPRFVPERNGMAVGYRVPFSVSHVARSASVMQGFFVRTPAK